jgi:hypothetical protein
MRCRPDNALTVTPIEPEDVAEVIWTATTDGSAQHRYIAGDGAKALLGQSYSLDQGEAFVAGLRAQLGL